jgi:hypothetical protein
MFIEDISDEYLYKIHELYTCLIASSEGAGIGLTPNAAAQNKPPIIARDISVSREVKGDHTYYFEGMDPITSRAWIQKIWPK